MPWSTSWTPSLEALSTTMSSNGASVLATRASTAGSTHCLPPHVTITTDTRGWVVAQPGVGLGERGVEGVRGLAVPELPEPSVDAPELGGVAEGAGGPEPRQLLLDSQARAGLGAGGRFGLGGPAVGTGQLISQARHLVL